MPYIGTLLFIIIFGLVTYDECKTMFLPSTPIIFYCNTGISSFELPLYGSGSLLECSEGHHSSRRKRGFTLLPSGGFCELLAIATNTVSILDRRVCFDNCSSKLASSVHFSTLYKEREPYAYTQDATVVCRPQETKILGSIFPTLRRPTRQSKTGPLPPGELELISVTENSAQLAWQPPLIDADFPHQMNYRIEIKPVNSHRKFSMMTQEPHLSFEELQPNTTYELAVFSYRPLDGQQSLEAKHITMTTKPEIYRLPMVENPKAESTEFATLKVSWELPQIARSDKPEYQINNYKLMLYNLAPHGSQSSDPIPLEVPGGTTSSFVMRDLQPDSFYKIRVMAVSRLGIDGHPATISSSPRIISRPPSAPPKNGRMTEVGAFTAKFVWMEPEKGKRNGEIVAYQLIFNSPDWLAPRELIVSDSLNYTLKGLNPSTNYTLTLAAATRAGIGPKSRVIFFTTASKKNTVDISAYTLDEHSIDEPGAQDSDAIQSLPNKVHNLRFTASERNILLLWSVPPMASVMLPEDGNPDVSTRHQFKGCIVRWGHLYPGPSEARVGLEKRAFSIEDLEPGTTYIISVSLDTDDGKSPSEMITAQTKPLSHSQEALIPLNVRVLSMGFDWAVMTWDPPTCSALDEGHIMGPSRRQKKQQRASPCATELFPLQYQLRYQVLDSGTLHSGDALVNCPPDSVSKSNEVNITVPWVRLEGLRPGSQYVSCVRAFSTGAKQRIGDWSFVQTFATKTKKTTTAVGFLALPDDSLVKSGNEVTATTNKMVEKQEIIDKGSSANNITGFSPRIVLDNGNSNIWLALAAIMVVTIVLLISVIVVVCWAKRGSVMVVRYKPDQQIEVGMTETNIGLLQTPSKTLQVTTNGAVSADEKLSMQMMKQHQQQHPNEQLIDLTQQNPVTHSLDSWTVDSDSMQMPIRGLHMAYSGPGVQHGIIEPLSTHGSTGDACSRGATGSSASSGVSLLPPMKRTPGYFAVNPLSNQSGGPHSQVLAALAPYMYPTPDGCHQMMVGQPSQPIGYKTGVDSNSSSYYTGLQQQPHQLRGGYTQPTTTASQQQHYPSAASNFIPPGNLPPMPNFPNGPVSCPGGLLTHGGPRIDLRAGENDGTYMQHPNLLLLGRGHLNPPCVNASDLISESSSGLPSSTFERSAAPHPGSNVGGDVGIVDGNSDGVGVNCTSGGTGNYLSEFSTVSSSNSNSSHHRYNSLPPTSMPSNCLPPMPERKSSGTHNNLPRSHRMKKVTNQEPSLNGADNSTRETPSRIAVSPRIGENTKAISTEELTQEMANLDGLMKDLSVITQNEFCCKQL